MEREGDLFAQYKGITSKLKKRFLKKPNISEAADDFGALCRSLENQECITYAGLCSLAQARCEHQVGSVAGEVEALLTSARYFRCEEKTLHEAGAVSLQENLGAAVNCYSHAVRVLLEHKQSARAASVLLQLADALKELGRPSEALVHYHRAAELFAQTPLDSLAALQSAVDCRIDSGDYEGALAVVSDMAGVAQRTGGRTSKGCLKGAYCDILARAEVDRLLLLLILQPSSQRLKPEYSDSLEKFAWQSEEETNPVPWLDEELFLLLQSVVMAVQSRDLPALRDLHPDLSALLDVRQRHLLSKAVTNIEQGLLVV